MVYALVTGSLCAHWPLLGDRVCHAVDTRAHEGCLQKLTEWRGEIEELQQCLLHSGGPPAARRPPGGCQDSAATGAASVGQQGAPEGEQRAVLRDKYERALRAYQAEVEKLRVANEKYTQEWRKKSLEDLKATLNSGPGAQQKENGELKLGMEGIKMEHQLEPGNLRAKRSIETAMHMKEKEGLRQKPQEAQDEAAQPRLELQEAQDGCRDAELRVHELEKLAVEYRGQSQAIESFKEQISVAKRKVLDDQQLLCRDPGQREEEESQNIRVWDLEDHICHQPFCERLFAPGSCPATNAHFHPNDNTLVFSTFSIGIPKGYLETQGRGNMGEDHTYSSPLCAILYNMNLKQVVSGCLNGMVNVWETATGRSRMEFSVTRDQHVELTAMSLDESERDLLTCLRDGTVKMWNYSTGECLLTFPIPDQLEISGIIHMNKVFCVTGWSRRITYFMIHKTRPVLLSHHWQTFHREDVLSMATYQSQCLGTSSCSGDILFWNINMFKPIFGFYASVSALPQSPKEVCAPGATLFLTQVQEVDECLVESSRPSKPCVGHKRWAYKTPMQLQGPSAKTAANVSLRRNLMSAPPKPLSTGSPKMLPNPHGRQTVIQENERSKGEFQKMLLQSHPSVEKIIFLQTRPRLPHMAALLSSCMDGYIYAWSIHRNGGLLGKFPVDFEDNGDVVVGAMATDENDWILVTGDCKGHIKIWDIKDYCTFTDKRPFQSSRTNKFRYLIPKQGQISLPYYIPLKEKEGDAEAEAWAKLQRLTLLSPWAGERSPEDTENSCCKWESKGKQVSQVLGAAYTSKRQPPSAKLLFTNVQYGWVKNQITPQIQQTLHFNELAPTHPPDFMKHKVLEQQGWLLHLETHTFQKDLDPDREMAPSTMASMPTASTTYNSLSPSALASGFLESNLSTSPGLQSPQVSRYIVQRSATPLSVSSSRKQLSRTLKIPPLSSVKKSSRIRF
ncbi:LOW QUALITY PROTEIN: uncharacterized protein [Manis javanica]|uniref:LOW QUALITY PROTEIN: uncharacterized protein n=1 Tax=Manis javanica TaxID=9974 RepID=UPI003C6D56DA